MVILHMGFICFVLVGGLLVLKWQRLVLLHIPAVIWGSLIEFRGWICPLTPLETQLRLLGGQAGYSGGFIEQYLLPVLYPALLHQNLQLILGTFVLILNLLIYSWVVKKVWLSNSPG